MIKIVQLSTIKANEKNEENSNSLIPIIKKKKDLQHSKLFHEEQRGREGEHL